jgi:DNA-binding LacI/PurR family transcriptional regulator
LTTVAQDFTTLAEHYAQRVVTALRGERLPAEPVRGEYRLVVRESA